MRDAGYTLLEMMVALVVFGFVMAGIAQSFQFGLSAWSAAPRMIAGPEALAATDTALTRMIGQALPGSMTGGPGGMVFTTSLPPGADLPDRLADVAIVQSGSTLVLRYGPHPAGVVLGTMPRPKTEALVPGITGLTISYLTPQQSGPVWVSSWTARTLPLLIRIHLRFADGRDWPDLITAPVDDDPDEGKAPST